MSDADYAIETADAGASETIPMEAGQVKKGGYVLYLVIGTGSLYAIDFVSAVMSLWNYQELRTVRSIGRGLRS